MHRAQNGHVQSKIRLTRDGSFGRFTEADRNVLILEHMALTARLSSQEKETLGHTVAIKGRVC